MKKIISGLLSLCLFIGLLGALSSCKSTPTLYVCNWGEYIAEGKNGGRNILKEFEARTGIKVKYSTFTTNESLYSKLAGGGVKYDIIIPSDYLIQKLIKEDRLQPLDFSKIPNFKYILPEYQKLFFDPEGKYSVPYTIGMVGVIYNKNMVKSTPDSWADMWNKDYAGQILQFESPRDAFGTAQFLLGQNINTTSEADWRAAADKLKEQTPLVQSYVADEVFDIMEGENAIIGPYYAGDCITMMESNPNLGFYYPKEGVNFFYDSICVPKDAPNYDAAMQFINFMLDPDIALANAEVTRYAVPHSAVRENPAYTLQGNPLLYPAPADMPKTQSFENLPQDTHTLMNALWTEVKGAG